MYTVYGTVAGTVLPYGKRFRVLLQKSGHHLPCRNRLFEATSAIPMVSRLLKPFLYDSHKRVDFLRRGGEKEGERCKKPYLCIYSLVSHFLLTPSKLLVSPSVFSPIFLIDDIHTYYIGVFPREGYISILFPREGYILRLFPREGYISILFPREGHDFWRQINCMYLKEHVLSVVVCGGEQPHTG